MMSSAILKIKNAFLVGTVLFCLAGDSFCQEKSDSTTAVQGQSKQEKFDQKKAFEKFEKLLSNSVLVGNFTTIGKEKKDLTPEEYRIAEVKKLDKGDYWNFKVRIKYMKYDMNVVLPLQVKWAGDTPVITVEGDEVKGFGTFNARVVIHENKYSGTWSHGKIGGHLFGTIKKASEVDSKDSKTKTPNDKKKDKE